MQRKMSTKLQFLIALFKSCILLLSLITKTHMVNSSWRTSFFPSTTVCNTEECEEQGKRLAELVNHSVDPCDDFYEYVCSKWVEKNPLPPYYDEWSIDSQLQIKTFKQVQEILEEPINEHDGADLVTAKKFHIECIKTPNFGIVEPSVIRHNVQPIGYFPLINKQKVKNKIWQIVHNYYLSFTGESGLFSIFLRGDRRNKNKPLLCLREILSPFGLIKGILTSNQEKRYLHFLTALLKEVMSFDEKEVQESDLEEGISAVIAFRMKLYKIKTETVQASDLYHPITVDEMNDRYNKQIDKKHKSMAEINWVEVIQHFTGFVDRRSVKDMTINIENKIYFQSLARLLSKTPGDVIANHMHVYFIERHTLLDPHLRSQLLGVVMQNGKIKGKIRYLGNKPAMCIAMNEMKETIERLYVKRHFSSDVEKKSKILVKELKDMLKLQIKESTWLDKTMINIFTKRVNDMNVIIGYPEYYNDLSKRFENPEAASMQPTKVDAFYLAASNVLCISAAYLNLPVYSPTLPYAMRYSGLGEYLSHEMYHAFGPYGAKLIKHSTSWPSEMMNKYIKKTSCFVDKFDKLPIKELKHMHPAPKIDGHITLEENMSDLMGLKLAYWAFRKKVWDTQKCEVLPGMSSFTCDHLFFISFASLYCTSMTMDAFMNHVTHGEHCTARVRVNEATSNFEIFNEIFRCPKSKNVDEHKTCDLWK